MSKLRTEGRCVIRLLLLVVAFLSVRVCNAQDPQFSLQDAAPLLLNPALAGADAQYRATLQYRNQWSALGDPFTTTAGSFDMALHQNPGARKQPKGKPAFGVAFLTDRSGQPRIAYSQVNLNAAYHVHLTRNSTLGAGFYTGFASQSIDPASGQWGSQYNGMQFDPQLDHGEDLTTLLRTQLDFGGGVVYSYRKKALTNSPVAERAMNVGLAIYHMGTVSLGRDDFFDDPMPMRWSAFVNWVYQPHTEAPAIMPGVYFHQHGAARMIMMGSNVRFRLKNASPRLPDTKNIGFTLGAFYRTGDAIIGKVLLEWDAFDVGLAYDVNVSGLSRHSSGRGAAEVMLRYRIN